MGPPPEEWQCRETDPDHVAQIYNSIERNPSGQILSEPCGVVIFDNELAEKSFKNELSEEELFEYLQKNPAATYHGEHRRQALDSLRKVLFLFKNNY